MAKAVLPKTNQTGPNEWADVEDNDVALREAANHIATEQFEDESVTAIKIAAAAKPLKWSTPKFIATEQSTSSTSFTTLTTADEITGIVLPENGLILVGYMAKVKKSVGSTTGIAFFLGSNQLKVAKNSEVGVQETGVGAATETFFQISTSDGGLIVLAEGVGADVTTGQVLGQLVSTTAYGGMLPIFAAAGTYTLSVKFKTSSGSLTAKERKLWVAVLGV